MSWPNLSSEKIAIFSNVPLWINRHPEGLEIAWRYTNSNQIHWINCMGNLASCPANSQHAHKLCRECVKQTAYTNKHLLPEQLVVHEYQPESTGTYSGYLPSNLLELMEFEYESVPIGGMVVSQLADDHRDRFFPWETIQVRAHQLLKSGIELYKWSQSLFVAESITTAFVWNGRRPSDGPVAYAAKHLGIRVFTVISDEVGKIRLVPDVSVQSSRGLEESLSALRDEGVSETDREVATQLLTRMRFGSRTDRTIPWYARKQSKRFRKEDSRPLLAIFTSSPFEHVGLKEFAMDGDLKRNLLENHLEDICARSTIASDWQVVVRFHPNLRDAGPHERSFMVRLKAKFRGVQFFLPEDKTSSYDILEQSDVVLTFGSTIGVEASWYGKPSLLIGRAVHENAGVCTRLKSIDELETTLNSRNFEVVSRHKVIEYLVAERRTHLTMEYVQMNLFIPSVNGVQLRRKYPLTSLTVIAQVVLKLSFKLQRLLSQLRINK